MTPTPLMKTTVIYHRADFDGLFCREIARKFLPHAELIGWDYGDPVVPLPPEGTIYILDLSPDCLGDGHYGDRVIWIDHHKSAIEKYGQSIQGYRIDGVAACRLAWQWFRFVEGFKKAGNDGVLPIQDELPDIFEFKERRVVEPDAVRLAGEYDIWDKRDPNAEIFQFGLRSMELNQAHWDEMLNGDDGLVQWLLENGVLLQRYQRETDKGTMQRSFLLDFEGLKFLALNTARCNSLTFASRDVPETGHDALLAFYWNGAWNVSLYHAQHRTDLDLSAIAVRYGGGGHRGACGFRVNKLPFLP